jgi:hypothetical protein
MSEVLELTGDDPKLDTASKRALIETELRKDASRSDREIGRVCGVDGKTVSAVRAKRAEISPQPPTPTERRHMLIEGCKDFDNKFPPGPSEVRTAEEAVDNAIADGKISCGTAGTGDAAAARRDMTVQAAVDQCRGAILREREERQAQADSVGEKNVERTLLLPRKEVTIQHDDDVGEWIIKQRNWPDEDHTVIIDDEDIHKFIDILTDHLGYRRVP